MDFEAFKKQQQIEAAKKDIIKEVENIQLLAALEKFNKAHGLNRNPPSRYIKQENGYKTLPISYVESKLRKMYLHKVKTHSFYTQVVGNEITGSITLEVFHPVLREWLTFVGAASKQILQRKGIDRKPTPLDQWDVYKFPNGLEKTFPALRAMCVKNAAKQIGKCFGSEINRKEDTITEETTVLEPATEKSVLKAIEQAGRDVEKINQIAVDMPHVSKYTQCVEAIKAARALAQCSSGGEVARLAAARGWNESLPQIVKLYKSV